MSGFETGPPLSSLVALGELVSISAYISSEGKWESSNRPTTVSASRPDLGRPLGGRPPSPPTAGLSGPGDRGEVRPTPWTYGGSSCSPLFCTRRHRPATPVAHNCLGELVLHRVTLDQLETGFRTEPANECSLPCSAGGNALGRSGPARRPAERPPRPSTGRLSRGLGLAALPPFPPHSCCSRMSPEKQTWGFILPLRSKEPWLRRDQCGQLSKDPALEPNLRFLFKT